MTKQQKTDQSELNEPGTIEQPDDRSQGEMVQLTEAEVLATLRHGVITREGIAALQFEPQLSGCCQR